MNIIVLIPPQDATQNEERRASLIACYRDGSLLMDGKDGKKPARFCLTAKDNFPWNQFLPKMIVAWQLCDYEGVPKEFRPQKRIPQFVLDGILNEPQANQMKILATLRQQEYFCELPVRREK